MGLHGHPGKRQRIDPFSGFREILWLEKLFSLRFPTFELEVITALPHRVMQEQGRLSKLVPQWSEEN